MDIVYICRKGDNEELRYSLRSVVKNLPESRVWIVGYKPTWYTGDFIPVSDRADKFTNIRNALKAACNTANISNDFVFMHDDIYIIKPVQELKPMYAGALKARIKSHAPGRRHSTYYRKLADVTRHLISLGYDDPLNYEVHVPMPMNKQKLITIIDQRYLERSMYGNMFILDAVEIPHDVKNYDGMKTTSGISYDYIDGGLPFLSSHDVSFIKMKSFLEELFPEPSKYEHP
jgi:hypothetical protein